VAKVVINLRCIEGLDIEALPNEKYGGKSY
jgi:hypothetical protein